jgi:Protein of unknown function (DUF2924)
MTSQIPNEIDGLRSMSRSELAILWQRLFKNAAPLRIRREIMVPFLAYKIQENAHGGLKTSTLRELRAIAADLDKVPSSTRSTIRSRIKPGSRLLRPWRGQTHEVFVTESGYEYRGVSYGSLSKIARKITGTRWSGPAFFGLNNAKTVRGGGDD